MVSDVYLFAIVTFAASITCHIQGDWNGTVMNIANVNPFALDYVCLIMYTLKLK